ncbi:BolA family protein [Candidatus Erwinia haradaeae]|nr:BolA/IbaG family iron-sulfur metabolism protein [Candidatus Erwinia haradaeae]
MVHKKIEEKLRMAFSPTYIDIRNDSTLHHRASIDIASHFKVFIVSEQFNNQNLLTRHRQIYSVLKQELSNGIHALSITSYTQKEWVAQKYSTGLKHISQNICCVSAQLKD